MSDAEFNMLRPSVRRVAWNWSRRVRTLIYHHTSFVDELVCLFVSCLVSLWLHCKNISKIEILLFLNSWRPYLFKFQWPTQVEQRIWSMSPHIGLFVPIQRKPCNGCWVFNGAKLNYFREFLYTRRLYLVLCIEIWFISRLCCSIPFYWNCWTNAWTTPTLWDCVKSFQSSWFMSCSVVMHDKM